MKIDSVEPSASRDATPHRTRNGAASAESFEASLMNVLDSGDEDRRASTRDGNETRREAEPETRDARSDDADEDRENAVDGEGDIRDVDELRIAEENEDTEVSDPTPPNVQITGDDLEADRSEEIPSYEFTAPTDELVEPSATEASVGAATEAVAPESIVASETATSAPIVDGTHDPKESPRIEADRVQDRVPADPRAATPEPSRTEAEPIAVEARPAEPRASGPTPQNIAEVAQLSGGPRSTAEHGESDRHSRGDREQRDLPPQESAPVRRGEAPVTEAGAAANRELPVDPTQVRNAADMTQSMAVRTDSTVHHAASESVVVATPPSSELSEPMATASLTRPMPPEAIPQHVEWLIARGGGSAQIELHPPDLGKLSIHVSVRGNEVQVVMNVQSAAAQTVVAEYRETLQQELGAKDLKLEQFEVRDWTSRDGQANRDNPPDRNRGNESRHANRRRGADGLTPSGVAAALMNPGGNLGPLGSHDGVNLRV